MVTTNTTDRSDTRTVRTPKTWAAQVRAFAQRSLREISRSRIMLVCLYVFGNQFVTDIKATLNDTSQSTSQPETRAGVETKPTYTGLFNYYTKLEHSETH